MLRYDSLWSGMMAGVAAARNAENCGSDRAGGAVVRLAANRRTACSAPSGPEPANRESAGLRASGLGGLLI